MHIRLTVCAVRSYSEPSYPRRDVALADPSLLTAHRPNRWKKVALSAAFALLTGAGCGGDGDNGKSINPSVEKTMIAPLFLHGRGYESSFGCMVVVPPNFLSEADARELIVSILKEHGLLFRSDEAEKIPLTITGQEPIEDRIGSHADDNGFRTDSFDELKDYMGFKKKVIDFAFDGINDEKRVAYEYVSSQDHYSLKLPCNDDEMIYIYNFRVAAARLGYLLEGKTQHAVGIFYDPITHYYEKMMKDPELVAAEKEINDLDRNASDYNIKYSQAREAYSKTEKAVLKKHYDNAQKESKELLRLQVLDFIEWLKAQGIL